MGEQTNRKFVVNCVLCIVRAVFFDEIDKFTLARFRRDFIAQQSWSSIGLMSGGAFTETLQFEMKHGHQNSFDIVQHSPSHYQFDHNTSILFERSDELINLLET